ncbi:hypothetical protein JOB18_044887 [Solea senegalensis]|uniref:Uncharacterized protein n=1 Tax=Solea senegalensis TaxID=28829 RepID=A0AAV6QSE1_SOLSE|nr:hypothetical protein JOB18_044887 [Solea senegalensis]
MGLSAKNPCCTTFCQFRCRQEVGIDIVGPFESAPWDGRSAVTLTDCDADAEAGASTYMLEDGRTWIACHCSLVPERAKNIITGAAAPVPEPEPLDDHMIRTTRVRNYDH